MSKRSIKARSAPGGSSLAAADHSGAARAARVCAAFGSGATVLHHSRLPLTRDTPTAPFGDEPPSMADLTARLAELSRVELDPGYNDPLPSLAAHVSDLEDARLAAVQAASTTSLALESKLTADLARPARAKQTTETAGAKWFNMPAPEMTPEVRAELTAVQLRPYLDPKHHVRSGVTKLPKFFQLGTVIGSKRDAAGDRLTRRERPKSLVDELLRDASVRTYAKRKFAEIQDANQTRARKRQKRR